MWKTKGRFQGLGTWEAGGWLWVPSAPSSRGNTWQLLLATLALRLCVGSSEGHNVNFEEVAADALLPGQLSRTLPWPDFSPP